MFNYFSRSTFVVKYMCMWLLSQVNNGDFLLPCFGLWLSTLISDVFEFHPENKIMTFSMQFRLFDRHIVYDHYYDHLILRITYVICHWSLDCTHHIRHLSYCWSLFVIVDCCLIDDNNMIEINDRSLCGEIQFEALDELARLMQQMIVLNSESWSFVIHLI